MSNFTKQNLQALRNQLNEVLANAGIEGIEFEVGNMRFTDTHADIKLKATISGAPTKEQTALRDSAHVWGLDTNKSGPRGEKLVGYKSRNRKYPFIFERNGSQYKCGLDQAKRYFAA